jgi:hypothetical protein
MRGNKSRLAAAMVLACGFLLGAAAMAQGEVLSIHNAFLEVKYDTATGKLSAAAGPRTFIIDGPSALV